MEQEILKMQSNNQHVKEERGLCQVAEVEDETGRYGEEMLYSGVVRQPKLFKTFNSTVKSDSLQAMQTSFV